MRLRHSYHALALTCVVLVSSNIAAAQYAYHYFKDPVAIGLDPSKIALYSEGPADVRGALHQRNIDSVSVESGPFKNWSVAGLPAQLRDAQSLPGSVRSAAQAPGLDFASPIFLDPNGDPLIMTPWFFVCFNEDVSSERAEKILTDSRAGVILDRNFAFMPGVFRIRSPFKNGIDTLDLVNRLAMRSDVRFADPDFIFTAHTALIPNDAGFPNCWGHMNTGQEGGQVDFDMDTTDAWDITIGLPSIIVMIMDVGVQQDHPDINQITGADYTGEGSAGGGPNNACDNHGTAVASCVSGIINNGIGTVGSAPGCKTFSARIGSSTMPCGTAFNSQPSMLANALGAAWQTVGAKVTNSSFSYGSPSGTVNTAYTNARTNGVVNFAAAGNGGNSSLSYPANFNTAVNAVAALNRFGVRADFSQYGSGLDFSAPGQDIYMADRTGADGYDPGDYVTTFGTSFATPYTCGVAALVFSIRPTLTPFQLETILANTCVDLGAAGYDTGYGWGMVNAFNAVTYAQTVDTDAPTPNPMSFTITPHSAGPHAITMQATLASDSAPVQYYFDYVSGSGGHDSGYQASRDYTDSGLPANSFFNYRVKARDTSSPFMNETAYSTQVLAATDIETPTGVQIGAVTDTSIDVQALGSFTNVGLPSTGFFFEMTPAAGSGANQWITTTSTTITGLTPCTSYSFRVKARNFQSTETPFTATVQQSTTGCICNLPGDVNSDTLVDGNDIAGYVRVKLGVPAGGDNAACADFGNNDLDQDTAEFVAILIAP